MIKQVVLIAFFIVLAYSACTNGSGGCTTCNGTDCQTCNKEEFFFLKADKTCVKLSVGCETANTTPQCTKCNNNDFYFLKDTGKTCIKLEGCQAADNTPKCTACNKSMYYFIKTDKTCVKLFKCEDATTGANPECKKCYSGYQLSTGTNKKCFQQITDCTAYNTSDKCTACKNNKKPNKDGSACEGSTENNKNNNNNNNSGNVENCTEKNASDSNKCKTCAKEYSLSSTQKVCIKSVGNCKIYNDTACTACDPGYTLKEKKCDKEGTTNANIVSASLAVILVLLALSL